MALVTFVRPHIFVGDAGTPPDIWDGQRYIGALGAGRLIQYQTAPGKHLFMSFTSVTGTWSYVSADLQAGMQYWLMFSMSPSGWAGILHPHLFVIRLKDPHRAKLMKLEPMVASDQDRAAFSEKESAEVKKAMDNFNAGKASEVATLMPADGMSFIVPPPESAPGQQ